MPAPSSVKIDPNSPTDFFVACETEHVIEYKLWIQKAGDKWYPIGPEQTNDEKSDHWIFTPPMPDGSIFAYWLGIWGHANTHWVAKLQILQPDPANPAAGWKARGTWTEEGDTTDEGNGGGVAALPSIPRVKLTA